MSYSKVKKIAPVLPPDQRRKLAGVLKQKQLFWNAHGMPIHLDFQDVDPSFITGMLGEVSEEYSGEYSVKVPEKLMYPQQIVYGDKHKYLTSEVKKLKLRTSGDFNRVNRFLERLQRVGIQTDDGNNNMLRSVRIQLHCPPTFDDEMFRHQIASYMIEIVDFLYPIMKDYLEKLGISFNTYIMAVYNGRIWGDEYVLATIGKMFNVRISVVSAFYSDIWNVFHDGRKQPDIVLVANGMDFGSGKFEITHFSATKGISREWKCVGFDIELKDISLFVGETDGRRTAADLFNINENNKLLKDTRYAVREINKLCVDIENICIDRDNILSELKNLKVKMNNFKRFTSYFVEDEYDDGLKKKRNTMPPAKKITEVVPSSSRAIPKIQIVDSRGTPFGQQLIDEAMQMLEDDSELLQVHSPIKKTKSTSLECQQNVAQRETFRKQSELPEVHSAVKNIKRKSTEDEGSLEEGEVRDEEDYSREQDDTVESSALSQQGAESNVKIIRKRKRDRDGFEELRKVLQVPKKSRDVSEHPIEKQRQERRCKVKIPMIGRPKDCDIPPSLPSLGIYEKSLEQGIVIDEQQKKRIYKSSQPLESQQEMTAVLLHDDDGEQPQFLELNQQVGAGNKFVAVDEQADFETHKRRHEVQESISEIVTKKPKIPQLESSVMIAPDQNVEECDISEIFPIEVESTIDVPFVDLSSTTELAQIHTFPKVGGDIVQSTERKQHSLKSKEKVSEEAGSFIVKKEVESSDSEEVVITLIEKGFPAKVKKEVGISSAESQHFMKIISTDDTDAEFQRRVKILADVHEPRKSRVQPSIFDHDFVPQNIVDIQEGQSTSGGITQQQESSRIKGQDPNPELDVFVPGPVGGVTKSSKSMVYRKRFRMQGKQTVTVQQIPSSTGSGTPVPPVEQVGDRYYCDKCEKSFKDLKYYRRHMTRLCTKLTNPEMLKCRYCEKLYRHENRFLDHLSTHDGKLRRQCKQCGKKFAMETQLSRHRKLYCTQRKK